MLRATVLPAGVIQIVLSLLGVARLMRFVPRSVMIGFVNALAILIFTSQLPYLPGAPWWSTRWSRPGSSSWCCCRG